MQIQIVKSIFLNALSTMKAILDLLEFKLGKKSDDYKYARKKVMDFTYKNLIKLFTALIDEKIIVKCECKAKLRQGYSDCRFCGGSGYRNK